ncbi:hypothetical protein Sango_1167400 [Sesamum angolense]|uniref:Uncharacterized protein n=1 Tax=Sesamum angolense TaxID=2727404 RepID=A0AAE1WVR8_9LAMI|nr:hypothetical protein Sango_1167400 [Sesamum angolense]
MQLGDIPLEKVNTSLYGFTGEVVHPRGMISLPLTLGTRTPRKTCMLKFLVVDVSSAYNAILGRPTLNAFQTIISTYYMKTKFSALGSAGEVQRDPLQSRNCYIKAVHKGKKKGSRKNHTNWFPNGGHNSKGGNPVLAKRNIDIFTWTPQDLEGIDPSVITHRLNINLDAKPVKQKKIHFRPENDKIIQMEVDKLMAAGHIEEIQFPEWLSNVVLSQDKSIPEANVGKTIYFQTFGEMGHGIKRVRDLIPATNNNKSSSLSGFHFRDGRNIFGDTPKIESGYFTWMDRP